MSEQRGNTSTREAPAAEETIQLPARDTRHATER
jgi:hypothetical protein